MDIQKPHPLVWIFNNAIENPQAIIDYYKENKEWRDWYTFGKMTSINLNNTYFKNFPKEKEWKSKTYQPELYTSEEFFHVKNILDTFYKTTKLYFKENNFLDQELSFHKFNIAKYDAGIEARMNYHTDYQQERYKIPGDKMHTTTLFYLNDDYKGGEIKFIELDENQEIIWDYTYKPKAGDVLVFSSMPPLYHGVNVIQTNEKYFIRTYWRFKEKPNQNWIDGVQKYGEKEWREMKEKEAKEVRVKMIGRDYKKEYITIQYVEKSDEG